MKKRLLVPALILAMLFCAVPVTVSAAGSDDKLTFEVETKTVTIEEAAGEIEVCIYLKNCSNLSGIHLYAKVYSGLTYKSGSCELDNGIIVPEGNLANITWVRSSDDGDYIQLAKLKYTVNDKNKAGNYPILLDISPLYDNSGNPITDYNVINGGINVVCSHSSKTETPAKSASCTSPGNNKYYTCSSCGQAFKEDGVTETTVEAETISKLSHDYTSIVIEPTCTSGGYTVYTCTNCGQFYMDDEKEPLEHKYKSVVTEPTCTSGGYTVYTCKNCGKSYMGDEKEPLEHKYSSVVTEPTCTSEGYTTYTCSRCGDRYTSDKKGPLGHSYEEKWTANDDSGHFHVCSSCGGHDQVVPHEDSDDDGICDTCKYIMEYKIIEGADSTMTINAGDDLTVRANGNYSDFTGVLVDGLLVDPEYYDSWEGSTYVRLYADYLDTLDAGKHTVTIQFTNSSASTDFTLLAAAAKPSGDDSAKGDSSAKDAASVKTGDSEDMLLWISLLIASVMGIAVLTALGRKKWCISKRK